MTGSNDPPHPHPASVTLDLDRSVSVLLNFLGNKLTASGSAAYRTRFGINITEFRVLAMLAVEPDILGQRFTEVIGLDPGATSRTLKALEMRGLVLSRSDDRHPAYRRWSLTREGAALQDAAVPVALERADVLLQDFNAKEEAQLVDFLRRMLKRMPDLFALNDDDGDGG
jgi:DNA-binding MarR family transcriptional regulator